MFAALDLETTGLYVDALPPGDPAQPRIISAGYILCEDDGTPVTLWGDVYVAPDADTRMSAKAEEVHGVSLRKAARCGLPLHRVLAVLCELPKLASRIVTYSGFDRKVASSELARLVLTAKDWNRPGVEWIDLMQACTEPCAIPSPHRPGTHKWPKLSEAQRILLGREPAEAHSALADAIAARDLYLCLQEKGLLEA